MTRLTFGFCFQWILEVRSLAIIEIWVVGQFELLNI